jgi:hypothetical protein
MVIPHTCLCQRRSAATRACPRNQGSLPANRICVSHDDWVGWVSGGTAPVIAHPAAPLVEAACASVRLKDLKLAVFGTRSTGNFEGGRVQGVRDAGSPVTRHNEEPLKRSGPRDNGSGQVAADVSDEELVDVAMSGDEISPFLPFVIVWKGRDLGWEDVRVCG